MPTAALPVESRPGLGRVARQLSARSDANTMHITASLIGLLLFAAMAPAKAAEDRVEAGRTIYEQGLALDGTPLRATSVGDSRLSGATAACIACHRRSGMGSREANLVVSPVTGPILFAKTAQSWPQRPGRAPQRVAPLRQDSRDAYDNASLVRAIRDGIDPNGRPLDPLMPRYEIGDADAAALIAYLRGLSAAPVQGLENGVMHLATVITPDADPVRSAVVTETLSTWARSGALGGIPLELQVWKLEGPPTGWADQLHVLYDHRPVYAVISGAGRAQWAPVRDFCERAAVPCLFPIVDLAPSDPGDFYTLYLSRGIPLEARMLARHLGELDPRPARVLQVVADEAGEAAARLLADEFADAAIETRIWRADAPAAAIEGLQPGDVLVGWLRPAQVQALADARPQGVPGARIVFSAQLAPPENTVLPLAWRRDARWVSARSDPARVRGKGVMGLVPWASHMKLPLEHEALLSEIYAATYFFGDALARMRGHWSREFLLETLETAHYARPAGSAYFSLSLAPGQREAAKAGHLLGFGAPDFRQVVVFGQRLAP